MTQYLTTDQRQKFIDQLAGEDDMQLDENERKAALLQGADMARADLNESDAPAEATPEADPIAERLSALGFENVEAMIDAYERLARRYADLMEDVRRVEATARARGNERSLESDPDGRSRVIQAVWAARAGELQDIAQFLPEMTAYIMGHPEQALATDGLERAYDAVRSHRYRSEENLLDDPEAVKRFSADPRVREAVLSAHLAEIYKSVEKLPTFIDDGGNIPAAAPDKGGMAKARAKLVAMLRQ